MTVVASGADWLETERLVLRAYRSEDFDDVAALAARRETFEYSDRGPMSAEEAWSRLLRQIGHWTVFGYGFFTVRDKASGLFLGETGLGHFKRELGPAFDRYPEGGWTVAPPEHGRGYATEAAAGALAWMEQRFAMERSVCLVHVANAPSIRVAEKLGFRRFGECVYKGYAALQFERSGA